MQGDSKGRTAACLDAETLAAWADGGLPKATADAVELHLADCVRCTAMLATFARTIPETPARESLWQRWRLQWMVPIATAATVAALWVLAPRREPAPAAMLDSAPSAAVSEVQAPSQPPATAESQPTAPEAKDQERRVQAPARTAEALAKREEAPAVADTGQAPAAAATPAAPEREADRADAKSTSEQAAFRRAAAPPAASPATSAPAAAADASPPAAGPAPARERSVATFAAVAPQLVITSPDPTTRWRVVGTGQVERTTNGGQRWDPATLPGSATFTGGSSPSPTICWLVGRTGAIYVTSDGLRFARVASPDRTDFVSIQALDARRATVVTSDARTFRTDDQGATWVRIAP